MELLKYLLKESTVGIKMMLKEKTTVHAFDIGKLADGIEYSFVMQIVPTSQADYICPKKDPFDTMCEERTRESAMALMQFILNQPTRITFEHQGAFAAMLESMADLAEEQGLDATTDQLKKTRFVCSMIFSESNSDDFSKFEYHLNRWLFNKKQEHVDYIQKYLEQYPKMKDYLKSRPNTASLVAEVQ